MELELEVRWWVVVGGVFESDDIATSDELVT